MRGRNHKNFGRIRISVTGQEPLQMERLMQYQVSGKARLNGGAY